MGFWGQSFYVAGVDTGVYNLISDQHVLLNAYFVQLQRIRCQPQMDRCFDHPGTYFGVLAFVTAAGDHLRITSGDFDQGFNSITINSLPLASHSYTVGNLSVHLISNRTLFLQVGLYELSVENMDLYMDVVNVTVRCWDCLVNDIKPEGLLGRTWEASVGPVQSEEELDQYREQDNNILGHNTTRRRPLQQ